MTWLIKPYVKQLLQNFLMLFQEVFKISPYIKMLSIKQAKKTTNKSHFTHWISFFFFSYREKLLKCTLRKHIRFLTSANLEETHEP